MRCSQPLGLCHEILVEIGHIEVVWPLSCPGSSRGPHFPCLAHSCPFKRHSVFAQLVTLGSSACALRMCAGCPLPPESPSVLSQDLLIFTLKGTHSGLPVPITWQEPLDGLGLLC